MKRSQQLRVIPASANQLALRHLIGEAKELMQMAYIINIDILSALHEKGQLSRREVAEKKRHLRILRKGILRTKLYTSEDVVSYLLHARDELSNAVNRCKQEFPELCGTAGGEVPYKGIDPDLRPV